MVKEGSLASFVQTTRKDAGLSQTALSEKTGGKVSAGAISLIERGVTVRPQLASLRLLAGPLGVSLKQFLELLPPGKPRLGSRPEPRQSETPRTNLTRRLQRPIGRDQEIAALLRRLEETTERPVQCVVITGPPGVGKTLFAQHLGKRLLGAGMEEVWMVDLSALKHPDEVIPTVGRVVGQDSRSEALSSTALSEHLRGLHALLILDTFEHVRSAAIDVWSLIDACPSLRVLVTSRVSVEPLADIEWGLAPLRVPDLNEVVAPSDLQSYSAVEMLVDAANRGPQSLEVTAENGRVITEICARLDGLPLALQLVAPWLQAQSPAFVLEELKKSRLDILVLDVPDSDPASLPPRQRKMREVIAWSLRLLSERQRQFFLALGVFDGGWTNEAAFEVCRQPGEHAWLDVIGILKVLVDHNLVQRMPTTAGDRFRMLDTLQEYAHEHSSKIDITGVRILHANYYIELLERVEPDLSGPRSTEALDLLAREQPNLRAAIEDLLSRHDTELACRLVGGAWKMWYRRGYLKEGRAWAEETISRAEGVLPELRARALHAAGGLAQRAGDEEAALSHLQSAMAIREQEKDVVGQAETANDLGNTLSGLDQFGSAADYYNRSAALYHSLAHQNEVAPLHNLAVLAFAQDDYPQSRALALRVKTLVAGDEERTTMILETLANAETYLGNLAEGQRLYEAVVQRYANDQYKLANSRGNLGVVLRWQGEYEEARKQFQAALGLSRRYGIEWVETSALNNLATLAGDTGDPEGAISGHTEVLSRVVMKARPITLAHVQAYLAQAHLRRAIKGRDARTFANDLVAGEELLRSALTLNMGEPLPSRYCAAVTQSALGRLRLLQSRPEDAASHFRSALRECRHMSHLPGYPIPLEGLASALRASGNDSLIADIYVVAQIVRAGGLPVYPADKGFHDNARRAAEHAVGGERLNEQLQTRTKASVASIVSQVLED